VIRKTHHVANESPGIAPPSNCGSMSACLIVISGRARFMPPPRQMPAAKSHDQPADCGEQLAVFDWSPRTNPAARLQNQLDAGSANDDAPPLVQLHDDASVAVLALTKLRSLRSHDAPPRPDASPVGFSGSLRPSAPTGAA
jgi:hypothetical protein